MKINYKIVNEHKEEKFKELRRNESMEGDNKGNVSLSGNRFNIMGADYFMADILKSLSKLHGRGAGGILSETGRKYGIDLLKISIESMNFSEELGRFLGLLKFLGYSDIEARKNSLVVKSSPTAEEYLKRGYDQKKTCYFISRIFTGCVRTLGKPYRAVETRCKADGSEKCVFELEEV